MAFEFKVAVTPALLQQLYYIGDEEAVWHLLETIRIAAISEGNLPDAVQIKPAPPQPQPISHAELNAAGKRASKDHKEHHLVGKLRREVDSLRRKYQQERNIAGRCQDAIMLITVVLYETKYKQHKDKYVTKEYEAQLERLFVEGNVSAIASVARWLGAKQFDTIAISSIASALQAANQNPGKTQEYLDAILSGEFTGPDSSAGANQANAASPASLDYSGIGNLLDTILIATCDYEFPYELANKLLEARKHISEPLDYAEAISLLLTFADEGKADTLRDELELFPKEIANFIKLMNAHL